MYEALRGGGYETSLESMEAALLELAAVLRTPAPTPAPNEPTEPLTEPVADVVELDSRRSETQAHDQDLDLETPEDAGRDPLETLYMLVDYDVRLEVRAGKLYAGRETGLTPRLREQLSEHRDALIGLLSEEAVVSALSEATEYVSKNLRRRGEEYGSPDSERAKRWLTMAHNAYERRDYDLCRYRLRRAEIASEGRYADVELPSPSRPASSGTTPEQRVKASDAPKPSERVEASQPSESTGDDLEPGRDHLVYLDRKAKVILLASSYPTEIALQGAKQAYQRANPGSRVEVRRSLRQK